MKCVDLFSGCGGLSLGFEKAGFDVVQAFDNWEPAIDVYKKNFSHPIFKLDLTDEDTATQIIKGLQPDLIMGGPPCQDFSSAGKRDLSLGRANLTYHFTNIVCGVRPTWFVMENVEQIKKSHILREIVIKLQNEGYGLSAVILDASYCGVPQSRIRFFLIGYLNDGHNQLNSLFKQRLSHKPMTIKNYLGDSLGIEFYYRHPRNYNRRGVFSINEPSPTVRGVNRPVPSGYKLNSCDPQGLDLTTIRPLTTIERSYIQTFPKSFYFEGTKTNLEQMIGNAVPVNLAKFVADTINIYINEGVQRELTLFELDNDFEIPKKVLHRT
ncbi:DNA cytosine methyltransferase [Spirulina sp. CCNP1310]|uniref:DNA cytosine methyltransferase n=1 Tax=Spirulina sp. CCNP1310 TaxID=3110249 RepID=UPI002B2045F9|nr:DNA cytosine methyltransferase [Spirulina sp. CCNP1310]